MYMKLGNVNIVCKTNKNIFKKYVKKYVTYVTNMYQKKKPKKIFNFGGNFRSVPAFYIEYKVACWGRI